MLRKRPSTIAPRLTLTLHEESDLRQLRKELEREIVDQYEQFLFRHRHRVDTTRWKAVRSHEDLHVFVERDDYRKTWRHESKMPESVGPMAALTARSSAPVVFVTGSVQGALDDALFGNTFLDPVLLRVRDRYLKQKADDASLLCVVDTPHDADPFSVLGVTYATRKSAMAIGRPRDLLLLTGVHAATLTTGERIGIAFHHSITHNAIPDDSDNGASVRANASMVTIYRQLDESRVDVFMLDFCDLGGKTPAPSAVKQSLAMLLPRADGCDAGLKKKLHWLLRERRKTKAFAPERDSMNSTCSFASVMPEPHVEAEFCDICDTSFRGAGMFSSYSMCQLCGEYVCGKCIVHKTIAIDATATAVEKKKMAFCVGCIHHAKHYSAAEIATRELHDLWTQSMVRSMRKDKPLRGDDCEHTRPTTLIH